MADRVIRDARALDLPAVVAIYNAAIPGRLATADTEPVTVEGRQAWFARHAPERLPLWVIESGGAVSGWLSVEPFYGRPAYAGTAEFSLYVAPAHRRQGLGRALLEHALRRGPALGLRTLLGFVFAHNLPSVALLRVAGFRRWGRLPRVAVLDGVERDLLILGRHLRAGPPSP